MAKINTSWELRAALIAEALRIRSTSEAGLKADEVDEILKDKGYGQNNLRKDSVAEDWLEHFAKQLKKEIAEKAETAVEVTRAKSSSESKEDKKVAVKETVTYSADTDEDEESESDDESEVATLPPTVAKPAAATKTLEKEEKKRAVSEDPPVIIPPPVPEDKTPSPGATTAKKTALPVSEVKELPASAPAPEVKASAPVRGMKDLQNRFILEIQRINTRELLNKIGKKATNVDTFINELPGDLKTIDKTWARRSISLYILNDVVKFDPKKLEDPNHLVMLIKSVDDERLKNTFNRLIESDEKGALNYIDTNDWVLREKLLTEWIRRITDVENLELYIQQQPLSQYQDSFAKNGIGGSEYLTKETMESLQEKARLQLLGDNRPALREAAKGLSIREQEAFLRDSDRLRALKEAKQAKDIKELLGSDAVPEHVLEDVAKEVQSFDRFKLIHNAALANSLSELQPPVFLTIEQIQRINQEFVVGNPKQSRGLHQNAQYTAFVNAMKGIIVGHDTVLQNALTNNKTAIQLEHQKNGHLLATYHDPIQPINEKLLSLFLNMKKRRRFTAAQINAISDLFSEAKSVDDFADKFVKNPFLFNPALGETDLKNEKNELKKVLSAPTFNTIKIEIRAKKIRGANELAARQAIADLKQEVASIAAARHTLLRSLDRENILKVKPAHLYHQYRNNDKTALKQEQVYKDFLVNSRLALDGLKRELANLVDIGRKNYLPQPQHDANQRMAQDLRASITESITHVKEMIKKQQTLINHLEQLNQAISDAKIDLKEYVSERKDFVIKTYDATNGPDLEHPAPKDPSDTRVKTPGDSKHFEIDLQDKLTHGQRRYYFYGQENAKDYFTEEVSQDGKTRIFRVGKFPDENPPDNSHRVNYSMAKAEAILLRCKTRPTKENPIEITGENATEVKYIWTALMALNEFLENNHPLKFKADAIDCTGSNFDPSDQLARFYGRFSSNSLYNKEFNNKQNVYVAQSTFKKNIDEKFNRHSVLQTAEQAAGNIDYYSRKYRAMAKEQRREYGSAPEVDPDVDPAAPPVPRT